MHESLFTSKLHMCLKIKYKSFPCCQKQLESTIQVKMYFYESVKPGILHIVSNLIKKTAPVAEGNS